VWAYVCMYKYTDQVNSLLTTVATVNCICSRIVQHCLNNRQLYTPYGPFRLFIINDLTGCEKSGIIMYNLNTLKVYHLTTI